jgi:hypothetical protein
MNALHKSTITSSQNLDPSFPPLYTLPLHAVCKVEGRKGPNSVIVSGFSFTLGLLLGVILTMCIVKLQARRRKASYLTNQDQRKVSAVQIPVYEELAGDWARENTSPGYATLWII